MGAQKPDWITEEVLNAMGGPDFKDRAIAAVNDFNKYAEEAGLSYRLIMLPAGQGVKLVDEKEGEKNE